MRSAQDGAEPASRTPAAHTRRRSAEPSAGHPISSVYQQLDASVLTRIDQLTELTDSGNDAAVAALARTELPRLVSALRTLLQEHHPDASGRCPTCRGRSLHRRAPAPCRAYLTAYLSLMITTETVQDRTPHKDGRPSHLRSAS